MALGGRVGSGIIDGQVLRDEEGLAQVHHLQRHVHAARPTKRRRAKVVSAIANANARRLFGAMKFSMVLTKWQAAPHAPNADEVVVQRGEGEDREHALGGAGLAPPGGRVVRLKITGEAAGGRAAAAVTISVCSCESCFIDIIIAFAICDFFFANIAPPSHGAIHGSNLT